MWFPFFVMWFCGFPYVSQNSPLGNTDSCCVLPILRQERRSRPDLLIFWAYWRKNVLLEKAETALIAQLGGTGLVLEWCGFFQNVAKPN
ncbi:MAG: hypothetical protein EOS07_08420 [Mesorhizobium sp.]|nr:MAG: hypothetical protein EOS07_08420 [Mesorhizobium sp.]